MTHRISTRVELAWQGIVQAFMAFRPADTGDMAQPLSMTQWRLLALLDQLGPLRPGEITSALGVMVPATSRLLRELEQLGYIERAPDPNDRRATIVTLASSGAETLASFQNSRRDAMQRLLDRLGADEQEELASHFERIEQIVRDAANAESDHSDQR